MALLEKAAWQGHVYAMHALASIHYARKEHEQAVEWFIKGAETGLPGAMFRLGFCLDSGEGVAAPDFPAAAAWYRLAADAGNRDAACNLCALYTVGRCRAWQIMPATPRHILVPRFLSQMASYDEASIVCQALGRGVTRSKQMATRWLRKAAENGDADSCIRLADGMYRDQPYAREVGYVGEAAGVATPAGVTEGHDVPTDVLTSVVHWLRKGGYDLIDKLQSFRRTALEGAKYCRNDGCEVVGQLKDFKVCPQCKTVRYCGAACQKADWTTGGHKATCGTFKSNK
jgi:TPR repeat protein